MKCLLCINILRRPVELSAERPPLTEVEDVVEGLAGDVKTEEGQGEVPGRRRRQRRRPHRCVSE